MFEHILEDAYRAGFVAASKWHAGEEVDRDPPVTMSDLERAEWIRGFVAGEDSAESGVDDANE